MMIRRILHVDMDAFYASVEQRDDPSLRGKPLAVGGQPNRRGVVAAASYEARAFGVYSAMPMARAVRLCPSLVIVRPDFARYKAASNAVFAIFREVTPLVEPLSLDEAYLDVTENAWGETFATAVARRLKERIRADTGLTASAGVAPNKFLAKIASGWKKPDGLTVISPDRVEPFLQQLPVDALWGVGPVTAEKLRAHGIERLVDVRAADLQLLRDTVGSLADWLRQLANGVDDRPVMPNREAKSSGLGEHLSGGPDRPRDDPHRDRRDGVARDRVARSGAQMLARTVTIKVRYDDFTTITRSHSAPPTRDEADLIARAVRLLDKTDAGTPAGPAARRQRAQFLRRQRRRRDAGSAAVRGHHDGRHQGHQGDSGPTAADTWDPTQYDKFQREREQPFFDLLALVRPGRTCASSISAAAPAS